MKRAKTTLWNLTGREAEIRRLSEAVQKRQSLLLWGEPDAGKTFLMERMLAELPEGERSKWILCDGPASRRQLVERLVGGLCDAGDALVRGKIRADGFSEAARERWVRKQSSLRLRGILLAAAAQGDYLFFLDHFPPITHATAHLIKELSYHAKAPVYLAGPGYTQAEIGYAWSLYWTGQYRIRLGPLGDAAARELLQECIETFGLDALDLDRFREEVLHLSGHLPGSIVKMCALAADPRYQCEDRIKTKLVHVDYLLRNDRLSPALNHSS